MPRIRVLKGMTEIAEVEVKADQLYTFGRSKTSSIILQEKSISRKHITIEYKDNSWEIRKLSKFGQLIYNNENQTHLSLIGDDVFSIPPFKFELWKKEKELVEDSISYSAASKVKQQPYDKTITGDSEITPYLKVNCNGKDEIYKLEGQSWIIGRSQTCQVIIPDKKVSREQMEIYKIGSVYYIKLIRSSNKTFLNNTILGDKVEELNSGDIIRIGDSTLTFEIRDAVFQKEIQNIDHQNVNQSQDHFNAGDLKSIIESQKNSKQEGVIRIDSNQKSHKNTMVRKKILMTIAASAVLFALFTNNTKDGSGTLEQASKDYKSEWDLLTPEQQNQVEIAYKLTKDLMSKKKHELAKGEIEKIHKIVSKYKDSKIIEEQIEQSTLNKRQKAELDRSIEQEKIAEENAKETLEICKEKYKNSYDLVAAKNCLAPAIELNPENPEIESLLTDIEQQIAKHNKEKVQRKKYNQRVSKGKALFNKAEKLKDEKKLLDAIESYEAHIKSKYPDPGQLKEKSKEAIADIKKEIEEQIQESLSIAEKEYANGKLKESIMSLRKALDLDPQHKESRQLLEKSSMELNQKMKVLYQDSVLEEHMGQIESALLKWKKIKELDIPTGDYYNKATSKLRRYSGI